MNDYTRRNTITSLVGHHYDTRGIVRDGVNPIDARVNTGPITMDQRYVGGIEPAADLILNGERRPYVSIDIETTDTDWDYGQILEFGAVIDDYITPLDKLPRFHAYLIHDRIQGHPFALSMNAEILRRIANRDKPECASYTFVEPHKLAGMFAFWATAWGAFGSGTSGKSLIPAGKNFSGFDRPWLKKLPEWEQRVNVLHRSIDPAMLYWDATKDQQPPSTQECYFRAGIQKIVAHNAIGDAIGIIQLIRRAVELKGQTIVLPDNDEIGDIDIGPGAPQSAKELAHKLSEYFRKNRQFTSQR